MSLRKLTQHNIKKVGPMVSLCDAAREMRLCKIGSIFIEEKSHFTGIITETDFVRKAIASDLPFDATACSLISSPLIGIDIDKTARDANHLMYFNGVRHLAVSENEKTVGLLSVRDLVHHFLEDPDGPLTEMANVFEPLTILMHRDIHTIEETASVKTAAIKMEAKKVGSLLVTAGEAPLGIVTETDLVRKVIGYNLPPATLPVGVIMNTPIVDIDKTASLREANQIMASKGIRHLVVTEAGKIIGILSIRDIIGMVSIRDLPRFFAEKS
ncbi:MAG: CBS domain-containing protein [Nitrospirae bacterium]|nr:CBS domain-containing protein [Candidatus Troglogloeales bacterium]